MSSSEEWHEVYGFDILFEVSNLGRVRTKFERGKGYTSQYRIVLPRENPSGYLCFNWRRNGKQTTVYLHRLVAEHFVENIQGLGEINHKDENKKNNNASNLEWCTHRYNCNYGTRNERLASKRTSYVECVETGVVYSLCEAARVLGICKTAISNCVNGRTKSAGGYTWRRAYVDA